MAFTDWILKPSKKQVIIQIVVWIVLLILLLLLSTDGLVEPVFQKKNSFLLLFLFMAISSLTAVFRNYFKNRPK